MIWTIISQHIGESFAIAVTSVFTLYLRRHRALELGVQALLRTEIISIYNKYFELGYCPIYAKENIEALYKQYKALGGNGTATAMTETIRGLPTELKTKEEKRNEYKDRNNNQNNNTFNRNS